MLHSKKKIGNWERNFTLEILKGKFQSRSGKYSVLRRELKNFHCYRSEKNERIVGHEIYY